MWRNLLIVGYFQLTIKIWHTILLFSIGAGFVGTMLSVLIRINLATPGDTLFNGNYQLYNVVVTAHALLTILFLVMQP